MRGTMEGGLWAIVVGTVGLSFVSLAAEQPVVDAPVQVAQTSSTAIVASAPEPDAPDVRATQELETVRQSAPAALDAPLQDSGFSDISSTVPPAYVMDPVRPLRAPEFSKLAKRPDATSQPVLVAATAPLTAPSLPQLPRIDLTTPAPPVIEAPAPVVIAQTPAPEAAPETPVNQETTPEADAVQAQARETMPVAQIPAPRLDDTQVVQSDTGVRINRPSTQAPAPIGQEAVIVVPSEMPEDLPALAQFGAVFENPDDLAVIGIVLLDDGTMADGPAAIAALGFAPTVVINALDIDAAARMAAFRAAGAEVAMQIRLPEGAQPVDVEVAFAEAFRIMPDVAMLYSDGSGVLQSSRSVTGQVMEILGSQGHGFVTVQRGLGNAARAAAQEGVPAATIDRELDSNGESSAAIGRALDQAGFRARQTGGAVLMGRLQEDTLTALRAWAEAAADDAVAPAPVSAVLSGLPE